MRLQKFMAECGVASRRKSEEIIRAGRVTVNGEKITKMGFIIDPETDIVMVDNKLIKKEKKKIYIALNKPKGYVSTVSDQFNRKTVLDLIKGINERIYPVGRLDYDTTGLLLLTNDGHLAYKLTHPSHMINKTYIAKVKGIPNQYELDKFKSGLVIDGYKTSKADIKILKKSSKYSILKIVIHEGRNRQVRKMCEEINHPVMELDRIAIGCISYRGIEQGKWRYLKKDEINYLIDS